MKKIFFVFILFISLTSISQISNGGFEIIDNTPLPPPNSYTYAVNHAVGWYNLKNTCDVGGCGFDMVTSPYLGDHNGGFGSPPNGMDEYMYTVASNLVAGQTYAVNLWVKNDLGGDLANPIGVYISPNLPSAAAVSTVTPQMRYYPMTHSYEKVEFCFTPTQSGSHYVVLGIFNTTNVNVATYYFVDEVSMNVFSGPYATTNLTMSNTTVCVGSNVVVDGSSSVNETSYEWDIYKYDPSTGVETLVVNGVKQLGQAGTYNASSILYSNGYPAQEGDCYRVYLTTYNNCNDRKYIQFCYEKPTIQFLNSTSNPICEGQPLTLNVTGENGWTYNWSTGQNGVGLKTVTVNPPLTSTNYNVTITTALGCTHTESINFVVHSLTNEAPTANGVNGTGAGNNTFYIQSGQAASFTTTIANDNSNELVTNTYSFSGMPSGVYSNYYNLTLPGSGTGTMTFNWNTGTGLIPQVPPGTYTFTVTMKDNNVCGNKQDTITYTVVVNCEYCPTVIDYENRTLPNTPLPPETKVGQGIYAGLNQSVVTGGYSTLFQAGSFIELGPNFQGDPGFTAIIDPATCLPTCNACCRGFAGFTIDQPLPNVFTPNGDGVNDVWMARDDDNPTCAFKAESFKLFILNQWGNTVYESINNGNSSTCCPYTAPTTSNTTGISSINWNGLTQSSQLVSDGVYFYILTLYGCGIEQSYTGNITVISSKSKSLTVAQEDSTITDLVNPSTGFSIFPNPTSSEIMIAGLDGDDWTAKIIDQNGSVINTTILSQDRNKLDMSSYENGTYFVLLSKDGKFFFEKVILTK